MGGFGGVADRLNAYNIYRGDPGQVTSDVERFERVTAEEIQTAARRYVGERPRVELSVCGRGKRATLPPLDRTVAPASAAARLPAANAAHDGARGWNSALGVSARGLADRDRIDRDAGERARSGRARGGWVN